MPQKRLDTLPTPDVPDLGAKVAGARHKDILLGADREAHDVARVVVEDGSGRLGLDVPQNARRVTRRRDDLKTRHDTVQHTRAPGTNEWQDEQESGKTPFNAEAQTRGVRKRSGRSSGSYQDNDVGLRKTSTDLLILDEAAAREVTLVLRKLAVRLLLTAAVLARGQLVH